VVNNFIVTIKECFVEFSHADGYILLLSKIKLLYCWVSAALVVVAVIGFYIFDVFVLPTRTVEVLTAWHLPHCTRYAFYTFISFITDIVGYGFGFFLATTYLSNYICPLYLFITDSVEKLK